MKKILFFALAALALMAVSCKNKPEPQPEAKVMARAVPERADDFVWENEYVAYRAYGKALEGNPTSPGFDIWVKFPGKLVANDWYKHAVEDPDYYHHDHGGKDCYKVAVSLGGGASVPVIEGQFAFPETNYRSYEIIEETLDHITFVLHYPEWQAGEYKVSLDKQITVSAGTNFCKVVDTYSGDFDQLTIAAGFLRHDVDTTFCEKDRIAIWEHASDQSVEPEDGMIGVAVVMPRPAKVEAANEELKHALLYTNIISGEPFTYWFGSCWSKGNVSSAVDWFNKVADFKM